MPADLLTDPTPAAPATPPAADAAPPAAASPPPPPAATPPAEKTWLDGLPEDLKGSPQLTKFKESGIEGVSRAYVNLERMMGTDKVPIPKDPNDSEAWDRYYKAGGRPDEPAGYEFQKPEKLPDGVTYDEGMETWWRQAAHEAGLSKGQAAKLFERYRDRTFAGVDLSNKAVNAEVEQANMVLQRDWGAETSARRALAKAAFAEMPQDVQQMAINSGLARMPSFVKYLHDIKAKTTGETDRKIGDSTAVETPDALKSKIADHRTKYAAALNDGSHPEHALRTNELTAMFNKLFPGEAA